MKPIERKLLRIRGGKRQIDVENETGINRATISNMENEGYDVPKEHVDVYENYLRKIERRLNDEQ